MQFDFEKLRTTDLQGTLLSDYLIAVDAYFWIESRGARIYDEPSFPVVELARNLKAWSRQSQPDDFQFDSMSFEDVGAVMIRQSNDGWRVSSIFRPEDVSDALLLREVRDACGRFIAKVAFQLDEHGINSPAILDT